MAELFDETSAGSSPVKGPGMAKPGKLLRWSAREVGRKPDEILDRDGD